MKSHPLVLHALLLAQKVEYVLLIALYVLVHHVKHARFSTIMPAPNASNTHRLMGIFVNEIMAMFMMS